MRRSSFLAASTVRASPSDRVVLGVPAERLACRGDVEVEVAGLHGERARPATAPAAPRRCRRPRTTARAASASETPSPDPTLSSVPAGALSAAASIASTTSSTYGRSRSCNPPPNSSIAAPLSARSMKWLITPKPLKRRSTRVRAVRVRQAQDARADAVALGVQPVIGGARRLVYRVRRHAVRRDAASSTGRYRGLPYSSREPGNTTPASGAVVRTASSSTSCCLQLASRSPTGSATLPAAPDRAANAKTYAASCTAAATASESSASPTTKSAPAPRPPRGRRGRRRARRLRARRARARRAIRGTRPRRTRRHARGRKRSSTLPRHTIRHR